ncbi:F-box protein [Dorcoceras hygrometricum]|uniref:F-box protein n=1 Tax=Dorcoceras hygrometricum TaxID=472368 RepID=A0A2Z7C2D4_9LAMI|nr:F-box protein [Dorcoceras hygrometricum]
MPSSELENKNKELSDTCFEDLCLDMQIEIIARVASASLADHFNLKTSCKKLGKVAEDGFVYERVCLDRIPVTAWHSANGRLSLFIHQCLENENPEALFRLAMVEYFCWGEVSTATEYLNRAGELGHDGVLYLLGIMFLFNGEQCKDDGMQMMSEATRSSRLKDSATRCRDLIVELLRSTKIHNPHVLYYRPVCCDPTANHGSCDACFCDSELSHMFQAIDYSIALLNLLELLEI